MRKNKIEFHSMDMSLYFEKRFFTVRGAKRWPNRILKRYNPTYIHIVICNRGIVATGYNNLV